jgi:hypothetical protein
VKLVRILDLVSSLTDLFGANRYSTILKRDDGILVVKPRSKEFFLSMPMRQSCRCCPWPSGSAARRTKSWSGTAPLPPPASWTVLTAFSDRAELPARSFEKGVDEVKPFDATSIE